MFQHPPPSGRSPFPLSHFLTHLRAGDSIGNALVCTRLLTAISSTSVLRELYAEEAAMMHERLKTFETFARGVLDAVYRESVEKAKQILLKPLDNFRWVC